MDRSDLKEAKVSDVARLARWLRLKIEGLSDRQLKTRVWWSINPNRVRGMY